MSLPLLAEAIEHHDAAVEGAKVIKAMLVVGLILAAPAIIGETYRYVRYFRRGRVPH